MNEKRRHDPDDGSKSEDFYDQVPEPSPLGCNVVKRDGVESWRQRLGYGDHRGPNCGQCPDEREERSDTLWPRQRPLKGEQQRGQQKEGDDRLGKPKKELAAGDLR